MMRAVARTSTLKRSIPTRRKVTKFKLERQNARQGGGFAEPWVFRISSAAAGVVFLASPAASYITGAVIDIEVGYSA
jgi:NAD(P)-dependent dehydrogenase (short-subunit alcohol dehydrogenase family)